MPLGQIESERVRIAPSFTGYDNQFRRLSARSEDILAAAEATACERTAGAAISDGPVTLPTHGRRAMKLGQVGLFKDSSVSESKSQHS